MLKIGRCNTSAVAEQIVDLPDQVGEPLRALLNERNEPLERFLVQYPFGNPLHEIVRAECPKILTVQPGELLEVEDRPAEMNAAELEVVCHVMRAEELAFIRHRPSHQAEVVHQGFGQYSDAPVVVDAGGVLAFRQLALIRVA